MQSHKHRAMSQVVGAIIVLAITIVISGSAFVMTTDMTKTQMANDDIDIKKALITNTDTESYLIASVKNSGNSEITNLIVTMNGFTDPDNNPTIASFSPDSIRPSKSTLITTLMPEFVPEGKPISILVYGNTTSGSVVIESLTIRP